jgi:hypothetical protein
MPSPTEITVAQLSRLVGLPNAPALVDVRSGEEFQTDPRLVPTSRRHDTSDPAVWWTRAQASLSSCSASKAARWPRGYAITGWTHRRLKADTTHGAGIGSRCCAPSACHSVTAMAEPFG